MSMFITDKYNFDFRQINTLYSNSTEFFYAQIIKILDKILIVIYIILMKMKIFVIKVKDEDTEVYQFIVDKMEVWQKSF